MARRSELATLNSVALLLGGTLIVTALYFAKDVFIPLTLAILLSFLLSPLVNRTQRMGVGNVWAVLVTAIFVFVLLAGALTFVGRELSALVSELPHYKSELVSKARGLAGLRSGMGGSFDEIAKEVSAAIDESSKKNSIQPAEPIGDSPDPQLVPRNSFERFASALFPSEKKAATPDSHDGKSPKTPLYITNVNGDTPVLSWASTVETLLGPLGTAGLVTVFVLFLLIYRDDMRDRIITVISQGDYVTTTEALDEVSERISKYLVAQTIVNVIYGFTFGFGLYLIGRGFAPDGNFPNFALWGAMATLLRFVPYIGPVVAAAIPIMLSIAVFPGYAVTVSVITLIVVIELACNNILEPWLYGASTGLSSVAIILSAVFWGWLWGPVGLLLSTPLTVCLVVLGRYVPRFRIFSTLLGEKVDIPPALRFYERLLSSNQLRSIEMLDSYIKANDSMKAIDEVLTPALRRARIDHSQQLLSAKEATELLTNVEQVIDKVSWAKNAAAELKDTDALLQSNPDTDVSETPRLRVLGVPAHHSSEELLLKAVSLADPLLEMNVLGTSELPDTVVSAAADQCPDVVLIAVLPEGGFQQARYLCSALRRNGFTGIILVCCHGKFRNFDRLFVKFRKVGANFLTTSMAQTALKLHSFKPRVALRKPEPVGIEVAS